MKKYLTLWVFIFLTAGTLLAQPGSRREKVEAMKIAFLTKKLDLTPEEAQKFWPVYNKYTDEMEKLRKSFRGKMMEELADTDKMTDQDADKALNDMLVFKAAEVELIRKYTAEFKKVLPSQKVVKLFVAEQEFKREILRILREKRDSQKN